MSAEEQAAGDARRQAVGAVPAPSGDQARQDEGSGGEVDLAVHGPGDAGAGGSVGVVAELGPGGGTATKHLQRDH